MFFQVISDHVVPAISAGEGILTLDEAAKRFKESPEMLRKMWKAAFPFLMPMTDAVGEPVPLEGDTRPQSSRVACAAIWDAMPEADRRELIRQSLYPQLPADMFTMFEHICQQQKLSLLTTDLFPKLMYSDDSRTPKLVIITTIRAFRKIADRTGRYRGQTECQWAGSDGKWVDTWNSTEPPAWSRVGILRAGFDQPVFGKASWEASAAYNETDAGLVLDPIWQKRGPMQLAKCAEADGYRRAFTDETANLYLQEEMQQAEREQKRLKALAERDPSDQRSVREFLRSSPAAGSVDDPVQDFIDDAPLESEDELISLLSDAGYTTDAAQRLALSSFRSRHSRLYNTNRPAFYNQVARDLRKEIRQQPAFA